MSDQKTFDKMLTAFGNHIADKEAGEIKSIKKTNGALIDNFINRRNDVMECLNSIYKTIIRGIHQKDYTGEHDIEEFMYPALVAILKEFFPTSEFSKYYISMFDNGRTHHLTFKITEADVELNNGAVQKYKELSNKKEQIRREISNLIGEQDKLDQVTLYE